MARKIQKITDQIRQDIVNGRLPPGARLPSQIDLADRFDVAGMTIRTVLKKLGKEGFIQARDRSGTYVSKSPPHLSQYGLVFWNDPSSPDKINWSRYSEALSQAADRLERSTARRIIKFHGVDWHGDSPDKKRLIRYLTTQQLAGVVFSTNPLLLADSPILEIPGVPRVAIERSPRFPAMHSVSFDKKRWIEKAVERLCSRGRRRVAAFLNENETVHLKQLSSQLHDALERHGMETRDRWFQCFSIRFIESAATVANLLMHDRERPDALIVMDDNYVTPALKGLRLAGINVPEDVDVVGHANFPLPPVRTPGVLLLGHDIENTLNASFQIIDSLRQGRTAPRQIRVRPVWKDELSS